MSYCKHGKKLETSSLTCNCESLKVNTMTRKELYAKIERYIDRTGDWDAKQAMKAMLDLIRMIEKGEV